MNPIGAYGLGLVLGVTIGTSSLAWRGFGILLGLGCLVYGAVKGR